MLKEVHLPANVAFGGGDESQLVKRRRETWFTKSSPVEYMFLTTIIFVIYFSTVDSGTRTPFFSNRSANVPS
jgi:hypothetical protein